MPALVAWLVDALATAAGSIAISAMLSIGLTYVTYKFTVDPLRNFLVSQLNAAPAEFVQVLGYLGVDQALTMVLSAAASTYLVGGIKRLVKR
jgi:hypothetical protein